MTAAAEVTWFGTPGGKFWHARSSGSNYPVCHRGIVLDLSNPMPSPGETPERGLENVRRCSKCVIRLERMARMARNTRLTASQTWERLEPAQREALLGWFLGSYAPSTYAQRYPLIKSETLTGAACTVSQYWKGALA